MRFDFIDHYVQYTPVGPPKAWYSLCECHQNVAVVMLYSEECESSILGALVCSVISLNETKVSKAVIG